MPKKSKKNPYKLKDNVREESLYPKDQTRVRKELLDYDPKFLKDLKENHPEEYRYLAQFTDEWAGGAVSKDENGKVKKGYLHKTHALAKDVYDRNNWRNNDVHGVSKANSLLTNIENKLKDEDGWYIKNPNLTEDALNMKIDQVVEVLSWEEYQDLKFNMTEEMILFYETYYSEN